MVKCIILAIVQSVLSTDLNLPTTDSAFATLATRRFVPPNSSTVTVAVLHKIVQNLLNALQLVKEQTVAACVTRHAVADTTTVKARFSAFWRVLQ